ncbi:MAG TPA: N-methyl-L-tryptophan oxidase [Longimicrobiales bacterium]
MNARDVLVVGLGIHGASLAHELARRGVSVLAVDAGSVPNHGGSTTGRTRITREAYYEHPSYVPLVQRATELWLELEELTGTVLLRRTGGLMVGPAEGELVRGTLVSSRAHDLPYELLDGAAIRQRFPALHPPEGAVGVYEPNAGVLLLDACMRTLLEQAQAHGALIRSHVRVDSWRADDDGVTLNTTDGALHAPRAVFTAGPWLNLLLAAEQSPSPLQLRLEVERQTAHWFAAAPGAIGLGADACPVTMLERDDGSMLYTLPDVGHGVKASFHHGGRIVEPDDVDRTIGAAEEERVRSGLEEWMPGAAHRVLDDGVCLYTNTPDRHFVIDAHTAHPNVTLVSACSGHGFKFGPALAEVVADLSLEGTAAFDISLFRAERVLGDRTAIRTRP